MIDLFKHTKEKPLNHRIKTLNKRFKVKVCDIYRALFIFVL